jgi:hypothetical protein
MKESKLSRPHNETKVALLCLNAIADCKQVKDHIPIIVSVNKTLVFFLDLVKEDI